ncbi:MAG: helix-turn-helix domain-containing protein [Acidaminococcus sp.]|nr:helix-turn-helix domain-containing protein [Acidaminococcus sp.]MCI2116637.1 helix-turn-helix domain-containing protein [Acidaminococcus sp.]
MGGLGNKTIMAKNIQYYMALKGIDRHKICDDLGFKYSTFSDWVNGHAYPRIDKIEKMAKYFGINKADLVEAHEGKHYYTNDDTAALAEKLRTNEGLRMLFKASQDLPPESMKEAYNYIIYLKQREKDKS